MKIVSCLLFAWMLILLTGCGEENKGNGETPLSENSLLSFSILYDGSYYPAEKQNGARWKVSLPESAVEKSFYAKCELEQGVMITPSPNLLLDYTEPVEFTLSNQSGETLKVTVSCTSDLPYYGIWLKVGDELYYPGTEQNGERVILVPGGAEPEVGYRVPEGGSIRPEPDLGVWKENEVQEFVITDAAGNETTVNCRWIKNNYFTMVVLGDPEYDLRGYTLAGKEIEGYIEKIVALKDRTDLYFEPLPGVKVGYDPALVLMVGDINKDNSEDEGSEFMQVFGSLYRNGIPCVTIAGNHDWQPYHWGDLEDYNDRNDYGYTSKGSGNNDRTLMVVNKSLAESEKLGVTDVHRFLSTDYGYNYREVSPFVFKFRGIRFYCGQCYWFQQWYKDCGWLSFSGPATFYNTDKIIEDLKTRIDGGWGEDPAVWIQHYPLTNQKEWWHDRQGFEIDPEANKSQWKSYEEKLSVLKELIRKTENPVFFAGHTHQSAHYTHSDGLPKFEEWVTGYFHDRWVYVVLMKENYGVVEVKKIQL